MIARLTGRLETVEGSSAVVLPTGEVPGGLAIEIGLPAYLAEALKTRLGATVTFHTLLYLEGQGQGTSFVPRLLGFASPSEREFFELFTTVKGIGNRKALRALALPPAQVAAAIAGRHTKALTELPEIGKRLAETVIAELVGKVDRFVVEGLDDGTARPAARPTVEAKPRPAAEQDAIAALCALGETRADAERKVDQALGRLPADQRAAAGSPDRILALVYAGR